MQCKMQYADSLQNMHSQLADDISSTYFNVFTKYVLGEKGMYSDRAVQVGTVLEHGKYLVRSCKY
jgi:hypothetical protein